MAKRKREGGRVRSASHKASTSIPKELRTTAFAEEVSDWVISHRDRAVEMGLVEVVGFDEDGTPQTRVTEEAVLIMTYLFGRVAEPLFFEPETAEGIATPEDIKALGHVAGWLMELC